MKGEKKIRGRRGRNNEREEELNGKPERGKENKGKYREEMNSRLGGGFQRTAHLKE